MAKLLFHDAVQSLLGVVLKLGIDSITIGLGWVHTRDSDWVLWYRIVSGYEELFIHLQHAIQRERERERERGIQREGGR